VCSDDHWLFVRPLPPGDVTAESGRTDDGAHRTHDGRDFRPFQASTAWVEGVLGELYWKARVGDRAGMLDLVSPPYMLSRERTDDEVAWSLGVYVPVRDVEKAFAVKLPRPSRVGPAQPNPHTPRVLGALVNTALCFVVAAIATAAVPQRKVLENTLALDARAVEAPQAFFFESVALRGHRNVRIHVDNPPPFALVQGSFVAASGAPLRTFSFVTAEDETLRLSAFPEGNYGLRLAFVRPAPSNAASVRVRIDQGRPGVAGLLWFTLLMSAPLLFFVVARSMFEKQRFEDSTF
jgi:hypothetical protein